MHGVAVRRYIGSSSALSRLPELATVYVADVRHNGWGEVPAAVLGLPQLVVLNASDNVIENVADGERKTADI